MTTLPDAQTQLDSAGCLECLTDYQLLLIQTVLLIKNSGGTVPVTIDQANQLLIDAGCLECLTTYQLLLIQTQALFNISQGSGSCLSCSDSDPVLPPPSGCSCSFHYNRLAASFWSWNSTTASWDQLIGG